MLDGGGVGLFVCFFMIFKVEVLGIKILKDYCLICVALGTKRFVLFWCSFELFI